MLNLNQLALDIEKRKAEHLYRSRRILQGAQGAEVRCDNKTYVSFCSNDYLGLANHPQVVAAFKAAADRYGVGSGASHLVTGHTTAHHALEEELADFVQRPRALLFSSGYLANMGVVSALCHRKDFVYEDKLNHASLIDAAVLSRAELKRYAHNDVAHLEQQLQTAAGQHKLIVTDGVFSMDGDIAPLAELARLAQQYSALLMLDDAHGMGVLGDSGRGSLEHCKVETMQAVPILMATLGKACGTAGAFVAGDEVLIETLIQQARTYIYTTALPSAIAEATRASLKLIIAEKWRRTALQQRIHQFRQGAAQLNLPLLASQTAIQPLLIGNSAQALQISAALLAKGILVTAIRPPTVPNNTARLRITFSAVHTEQHVQRLLSTLAEIYHEA